MALPRRPIGPGLCLIAFLTASQSSFSLGLLSQQAYLKAQVRDGNDQFGMSVGISGDTVVVGAVGEDGSARSVNGAVDNNAPEAGAAYVYLRGGGGWSQQAYLKASNADAGDRFGRSVAISGDTIVVGAYSEASNSRSVNGDSTNNGAPDAGAAYVFVRQGSAWIQQAYLKASNADGGDFFGWSVAIAGERIVVGAWSEDSGATGVNGDGGNNGASQAGAAYIFDRVNGVWSQTAYLKASNTESTANDDLFGMGVAVAGDLVLVGAPGEDGSATAINGPSDNAASQAGAAYVFAPGPGGWQQQAYLKAPNAARNQRFGDSVALSDTTAAIGVAGGVIVFVNTGSSSWTHQASLGGIASAGFGGGVTAISGNLLVAGAGAEESTTGAAYVFERSGTAWTLQQRLVAANRDALDLFGFSVAIAGETVVVGARSEGSLSGLPANNAGASVGAAYVFGTGGGSLPGAAPGAPSLSGQILGTTATVQWTPRGGGSALSYDVQASVDSAFTQIFLTASVGSATSVTGTVAPGFRAWVRVVARNDAGQTPSNAVLLEAGSTCAGPPPAVASLQVNKTASSATVSWAPAASATSYRVEADVNGQPNVFTANIGGVTSVTGTNLSAASYVVRVYALNTCGESLPTTVTFTMP
jgi:hypothetical protein